ncbi:MAG: ketopantoate reductase family protein [Kofleriaceae bacterium]
MRVLVVGAGAVGQVYGRHLRLGGAEVTFFVREKYRAEALRGFTMYALNRSGAGKTERLRFTELAAISSTKEITQPFDQVWLTVSSPALQGAWLPELAAATGPDAIYVMLQPGLEDRRVVEDAGVPSPRIVAGVISMISYHAPLPGETRFPEPGMAYWFPPGAPTMLSGERARSVVDALRAGKCPAKVHRDAQAFALFPSAIMHAYLVALEASGWKFRALFGGSFSKLAAQGSREALAALSASTKRRVPFAMRLVARKTTIRTAMWFARRVVPLPLETYFEAHFTKVGDQTREFMSSFIALGKQHGTPVGAMHELVAALPESTS